MRKSGVEITRSSGVCAVVCLIWGWSSCAPESIPARPRDDSGVGGPFVAGIGVPASGTGAVAGRSPIAGSLASAGGSSVAGQSGMLAPPVAGSAAVAANGGGSAGTMMPMHVFDAGSDASRNVVGPGELCARLAAIDCAGEAYCCNSPGRTVDACRTAIEETCTSKLYLDQLAMNPVTGFDQAAATAAFTELEQKASRCDVSVATWGGSTDGLRSILKGTLAPNANCKPMSAMVTDPATAAAALASCTGITTTACLPKSLLGSWTCAPHNGAGGSCVTDVNCNDGLYCNNPKNTIGTCAARLAVGASCSLPNACASLFCKSGHCVAADQQVAYCLAGN